MYISFLVVLVGKCHLAAAILAAGLVPFIIFFFLFFFFFFFFLLSIFYFSFIAPVIVPVTGRNSIMQRRISITARIHVDGLCWASGAVYIESRGHFLV